MSAAVSLADYVTGIAQDVFTAMVDGEPGHLTEGWDGALALAEPVQAWVDLRADGERPTRVRVTTGRATADRLARLLLALAEQDTVTTEDLRDAIGEVANVVGGNLKGLMDGAGVLTLPAVLLADVPVDGTLVWERRLSWRSEPLVISMWHLNHQKGPDL